MDRNNVIEQLANLSPARRALLERRLKGKELKSLVNRTIPRRATRDTAPLSFAQQRLWFLDQLEPGSAVYNVPGALRLRGSLDVGTLGQSLHEIMRRHESLRTTFSMVEGEPVQVISPSVSVPFHVMDLTECPESEREGEARRLASEEARRPFDLTQGPLLRTTLIRLGKEDHVLLLTMHHIVSDGWSMGVLYRELSVLYEAFSKGQPSPLSSLPIQYADFAVWQRKWLRGEVLESQLSYWKKQLEGVPAVLSLPTDRPRPAVQSFRGQRQSIELSKELTQGLKALSRKEGVTLFMTLLAAFQTLLYRYTGQEDIVVGSPIANRNRTEIEGLIGFFVNTLVLRCNFSGNPTFKELLATVREVALGAYAHQDLPFENLVEELQPERSLSHSPLFQVMFVLQNAPNTALKFEGLSVSPVRVGANTAKFDLTLSMHEAVEGLRGSLEYNTDLFDDATMTRMLDHFEVLLQGIVANPAQRLSNLPLLTEAEKRRLLVEWNDTKTDYPRDRCIHELLEAQVERSPEAVAVVFEGKQLTYRELNQHANQLARFLSKLGVEPRAFIGICMERSLETVVAALAILKAGRAYVPLDPEYPKERLGFMLRDAQTSILLTQERLLERLPESETRCLCIDTSWESIGQESKENLRSGVSADDLAYVIYTSGSTGTPKGVAVTHRAVNRLVMNTDYAQLTCGDVVAQAANFSFDATTFELWGALLHGARLVVIPQEDVLSPTALAAQIENEGITAMFLTTALFNQLVENIPSALGKLHHLLFGGEAVDPRRVKELLHKSPPKRLLHVYGPTETTTFASWYLVKNVAEDAVTIPIGRPIANTQIYLLDQYLQPVPVGVPGELYIGEDGLALGYHNRPELTAEKFIPHPFSAERGARLYRTGDLARYLSDGNIEFLGRVDHQVKIRGFRIELGEIESVLSQHPALREIVVTAREDVSGDPSAPLRAGKRLVAYVVPNQHRTPTTPELRSFLKEKLPDYMVPSAFVFLDALPLTPNGKVDRRALPSPEDGRPESEESYVAPRTPTEELLAAIWADVLKVERVGIHDNFFDLGGHSLLVAQLFSRMRGAFKTDLPIRYLFEFPTVAGLAAKVVDQTQAGAGQNDNATNGWSYLVEIQTGGHRRPVFFFPGGWGNEWQIIGLARLARQVGSDYPFYALQARSAEGVSKAQYRVEEMAADYLREIRAVQPQGPYFLVGECVAGAVAYEIARQLRAQGQEIALLGFMDSRRPTPLRYVRYRAARIKERCQYYLARFSFHWTNMRRLDWRSRFSYVVSKTSGVAEGFSCYFSQVMHLERDHDDHAIQGTWSVGDSYAKTLLRYRPQLYDGQIAIFVSKRSHQRDPTMGWSELTSKGLDIHVIPGNHVTYRREHVDVLGRELRACLERAQGDG